MATGNLDVAGLMMMVRRCHSEPGKVFVLSPVVLATADKIKGWIPNRYCYAIREAISLGLLLLVHMGGRASATHLCTDARTLIGFDLNQTPPSLSPREEAVPCRDHIM
jgi:hypothetical protein